MTIALIAIFFAGIANFAMNRAMVESRDPVIVAAMKPVRDRLGPYGTYLMEYIFLVAALSLATRHWFAGLMIYGIYTIFNAIAFTMIHHRPR
ncbi:MAG TPA: hypothetical protein VFG34_11305 [Sphingopyxis sp.]|nr:hypothetical protein [Sphingopyxis sp.]